MIITSTSYLVPQSVQVVSSQGTAATGVVVGPSEALYGNNIGMSVLTRCSGCCFSLTVKH